MFSGSIPALVTPFDDGGAFVEAAFRDLVDWQIAEGSTALVPCGTTGEAATMTAEEHFHVVARLRRSGAGPRAGDRRRGSNDTRVAIANIKAAQGLPAPTPR